VAPRQAAWPRVRGHQQLRREGHHRHRR
jgi:hypothetical protein